MRASEEGGFVVAITRWRRYSRGEIARPDWIKDWVDDWLDDEALAALPLPARYLYHGLKALASRQDGLVPLDPRRIAGRLSMRPRDVTLGLKMLQACDKVELIPTTGNASVLISEGNLQLPLTSAQPGHFAGPDPTGATPGQPLSPRARARTEQDKDLDLGKSKAKGPAETTRAIDNGDLALPLDEPLPETLARLVRHAANGDARSAALIIREAEGLPEACIARTLESLLYRRPRPRNPGGYVVQTLRRIRREGGYPDLETATVDREPEL